MRIVAGRWRGRRLSAPEGTTVRPTADRVREAWMSILQHQIPHARVLDLFAGSGALGLEALSRGAASADFVDSDSQSLRAIRANVEQLGAQGSATVHRADAMTFVDSLRPGSYDVAFADPPYRAGLASAIVERWLARPFAELLGVQHEREETLPGAGDARRYGSTTITLFRRGSAAPPDAFPQ